MFTLSTFYQSKEWTGLLKVIRDERKNNEGFNVCEYCGEPIIKAYDCIGHHKEHLTEQNVNDVMISLNPDNVALVHHKCHNIIHNKLGYSERKIYLIYGAPLSGKTTWVNGVRSDGDLIVDMDSIWQCVSGCDRYIKPNRLRSVVFGVRDRLLEDVKYRRGKWSNAYIIGGYALISERERLCKELGAEPILIECSQEECLNRLSMCNDRNVIEWTEYINKWFMQYGPPG